MKIVDRNTFLAMPAGTIFAKYEPHAFEQLSIKGDSIANTGPDAEVRPFIDFYANWLTDIAAGSQDEQIAKAELSLAEGLSLDPNWTPDMRDGCFGDDQFLVWEEKDRASFVELMVEEIKDRTLIAAIHRQVVGAAVLAGCQLVIPAEAVGEGLGRHTPVEIETLLRYYWSPEPPRVAPAVQRAIAKFTARGWTRPSVNGCYELTEEGTRRVDQILHVFDTSAETPEVDTITAVQRKRWVALQAELPSYEIERDPECIGFWSRHAGYAKPTEEGAELQGWLQADREIRDEGHGLDGETLLTMLSKVTGAAALTKLHRRLSSMLVTAMGNEFAKGDQLIVEGKLGVVEEVTFPKAAAGLLAVRLVDQGYSDVFYANDVAKKTSASEGDRFIGTPVSDLPGKRDIDENLVT